MRDTHRSTAAVIEADRRDVPRCSPDGCCGALHAHAGLGDAARRAGRARDARRCPATRRSSSTRPAAARRSRTTGTSSGTPEAARLRGAGRRRPGVAGRRGSTACRRRDRRLGPVIVQDPCHLRHVQRAHEPVRTVLGHVADVVELDDEGLCCGAGGAYSALQPALAGEVRDAQGRPPSAGPTHARAPRVVASANPGCAMHLAAAGLDGAPPGRPRGRGPRPGSHRSAMTRTGSPPRGGAATRSMRVQVDARRAARPAVGSSGAIGAGEADLDVVRRRRSPERVEHGAERDQPGQRVGVGEQRRRRRRRPPSRARWRRGRRGRTRPTARRAGERPDRDDRRGAG